jgi:hypothetical protein
VTAAPQAIPTPTNANVDDDGSDDDADDDADD